MYGPPRGIWNLMIIFMLIGFTFGLWKIIEVIIWVFRHLHWR